MDNIVLEQSKKVSEVMLGVHIQNDLKWSCQIKSLSNKLKTRLAAIQKIKSCVNGVLRKTLVEGLFNSVLCYCLPVFGGASNQEIESLQVLQNKAARLALKATPGNS